MLLVTFPCFQCKIGESTVQGDGFPNKRLAKRSAAEAALRFIGVNPYPSPQPDTDAQTPLSLHQPCGNHNTRHRFFVGISEHDLA